MARGQPMRSKYMVLGPNMSLARPGLFWCWASDIRDGLHIHSVTTVGLINRLIGWAATLGGGHWQVLLQAMVGGHTLWEGARSVIHPVEDVANCLPPRWSRSRKARECLGSTERTPSPGSRSSAASWAMSCTYPTRVFKQKLKLASLCRQPGTPAPRNSGTRPGPSGWAQAILSWLGVLLEVLGDARSSAYM